MSGHLGPETILAERYRIVRAIAEGGMGRVYEAVHTGTRRRVALKTILPEYATDPDFARGLRREAIAASALQHQHIVETLDFGIDEGCAFLVMELLPGESLATRLARTGPLGEAAALRIALAITRALGAAHDVGIVHRDLKPSNVFLVSRPDLPLDHVKVLDFGVAKLLGTSPLTEIDGHRTRPGAAVGTLLYMAPEQARGVSDIDARADVYAVGRVLFECLTNRPPFEAGNAAHFVAQLLTEDPPPVRTLAPEVSPATEAIVARCLERDPARRYGSASELARDLADAERAFGMEQTVPRSSAPSHFAPEPTPSRGRGRFVGLGLALVALVVGAVVLPLLLATPDEPAPRDATPPSVRETVPVRPAPATELPAVESPPEPANFDDAPRAAARAAVGPNHEGPRRRRSTRRQATPVTSSADCPEGRISDGSGHCCPSGTVWIRSDCRRPLAQ